MSRSFIKDTKSRQEIEKLLQYASKVPTCRVSVKPGDADCMTALYDEARKQGYLIAQAESEAKKQAASEKRAVTITQKKSELLDHEEQLRKIVKSSAQKYVALQKSLHEATHGTRMHPDVATELHETVSSKMHEAFLTSPSVRPIKIQGDKKGPMVKIEDEPMPIGQGTMCLDHEMIQHIAQSAFMQWYSQIMQLDGRLDTILRPTIYSFSSFLDHEMNQFMYASSLPIKSSSVPLSRRMSSSSSSSVKIERKMTR